MKRPLSLLLAEAFDRAAHDVFVAPQVAAAEGESDPSKWTLWVTWWRGFFAGWVGDDVSLPLARRLVNRLKIASHPDQSLSLHKIATRVGQRRDR
jgi:hypothetical protein